MCDPHLWCFFVKNALCLCLCIKQIVLERGDRWLGMDVVVVVVVDVVVDVVVVVVVGVCIVFVRCFPAILVLTVKLLKSFSFQTIFILVDFGCV